MNIAIAGEDTVIVYFADAISPTLPTQIAQTSKYIKSQLGKWIIDFTPAYTSLLIRYSLNKGSYQQFYQQLEDCLLHMPHYHDANTDSKTVKIPVYYHSEVGFDLQSLLAEKQIGLAEFIELHANTSYLVHAVGFSPNFAFLGEVSQRIQLPRLDTPRIKIPAGSVGVANNQTAIYPSDSSGGWRIIGRTPLDLSLNKANTDYQFNIADQVIFEPISRALFLQKGGCL